MLHVTFDVEAVAAFAEAKGIGACVLGGGAGLGLMLLRVLMMLFQSGVKIGACALCC